MLRFSAIAFLLFSSAFTYINYRSIQIDQNTEICKMAIGRYVISWASGCFYSKDNLTNYGNYSEKELIRQYELLNSFTKRGGFEPEILWHKLKFSQKHQMLLKLNFQSIHEDYLRYRKSEHTDLTRQINYLNFLVKNQLTPLAQDTLDSYCDTYLPSYKIEVVEQLEKAFNELELPLKSEYCRSKLDLK